VRSRLPELDLVPFALDRTDQHCELQTRLGSIIIPNLRYPTPHCSDEPPIFSQLLTRANETKLSLRSRLCIRL
jgi:hypothetical protein